ncbi:hypothetical protein LR48_Vigan09g011400 [Vigna angularis]|uniref:Rx N-terminal domain-containing protein n=2 Tax=Phaseolus angularis TaxID=3914 RepID=A0A0L9V8Q4_PHAAN|nr:uncharacterized protein LOC108342152 [Vigna angularis]KOM51455.1 hypothetical protein LR48_Vigan09g011400 [Vigna angularis]
MSIRTNRMKAVPSLQRRLTSVKSREEPNISDKLDRLMSDLTAIKDLFSTVKSNEEELLDTLKLVDDLLRNFKTEKKFHEISRRILETEKADPQKGSDEPSSSQKAEEKSGIKDETIDEKLENLEGTFKNLKANFSTLKKNEELRRKLRELENFLQNFNSKLAEDANEDETKGLEQPSQTSMEEMNQDSIGAGTDKPSSSQLTKDKKSIVEVKSSSGIAKPSQDSDQSETKSSELPRQNSREESLDQDLKATGIEKPASSQETRDEKSIAEKDRTIEEKFESFMSKLDKIKGMSSKENEELRKKLEVMEDLLRKFNSNQSETKNLELPTQIKRDESVDKGFKASGVDKPASNQEPKDENFQEKYVPVDEKLESLKLELDNMKAKFSPAKENEEMTKTLRTLEDLLQSIDIPAEDANPTETKGSELTSQISRGELENQVLKGVDKPSSSQEVQDKESVEKDVSDDEKVESLKSERDNEKADLVTLNKNKENLIKHTNKKVSDENVKRKDSKEEVVEKVVDAINEKIKKSTKKLGVSEIETKANESSEKGKTPKTVHYSILPLSRDDETLKLVLKRFQASYDALNSHSKVCCLSLSIFPENVVIMKRHIIYWWIGEGFVKRSTEKTAEEEGENVFDELLNSNLIVPHGLAKCPVVNKFKINPWIRHMLVSSVLGENKQPFGFYSQITTSSYGCLVLDQQKVEIRGDFASKSDQWRSVFNLGAKYLTIEPQWMAKMKKLVVLQLGRWQESPEHHIEVAGTEFMTDTKAQKHLKYLSLRGISRISALPPSIAQLVSLEILDLKACHNLETLPNEITSLKKLTHLDVSQCYLLESMPKGIGKLTELQVLKGFVVGSSNKTPTISDLANFKKLKRLSIHIGSEAVIQDKEFENLRKSQVKCLKISWGVSSNTKYKDIDIVLPQGLEKLNLEGFPGENTPAWLKLLPSELKRLYIIGGKLRSIEELKDSTINCKVEILRLKYLKNLQIDIDHIKKLFPSLKYAEVKKFKEDSYEWSNSDGKSTPIS